MLRKVLRRTLMVTVVFAGLSLVAGQAPLWAEEPVPEGAPLEPAVAAPCTNLVANPGFETGTLSGWTVDGGSNTPFVDTARPYSGAYSARLGNFDPEGEPCGNSSFYQSVTLPSTPTALTFWYWPYSSDGISWDWQDVYIQDAGGSTLATVLHTCSNAQSWQYVSYDLSPYVGQTIRIKFLVHQDCFGDDTGMYLDDVTICGTTYTASFLDDGGACQICVDPSSGAWQVSVLRGRNAGKTFSGTGTVRFNRVGYVLSSSLAERYWSLSLQFSELSHRAYGYFNFPAQTVYLSLLDGNTLDAPPCP